MSFDLLELVEVDEQQCAELVAGMRHREQMLDLVAEVQPVRQRGQLVVPREMRDARLRAAAFGDVLDQHDAAAAGHRLERPGQRAALGIGRIGRHDLAGQPVFDLGDDQIGIVGGDHLAIDADREDVGRRRAAAQQIAGQTDGFDQPLIDDGEPPVGAEHAQAVRHVV